MITIKVFYLIKPFIPRWFQLFLRRKRAARIREIKVDSWPIDKNAATPPENWEGWPDNKKFALVLTHDIETAKGQSKCLELMKLEKEVDFRSAFYFVPERYPNDKELIQQLKNNGFEIGLHGLKHDGKLFRSKNIFVERAPQINKYINEYNAVGFRSPATQRNFEWMHELDIEYDSSGFDTDPFEPHGVGEGTIFPFWIKGNGAHKGYVELPYTLSQDFTLYIILKEENINIWKKKLDWIAENGGMALIVTHPDYMNFSGGKLKIEEYPAKLYVRFLDYVKTAYEGTYWHALPRQVAKYISKTMLSKKNTIPL